MQLAFLAVAVAVVPLKYLLNLDHLFLSASIVTVSLLVILVKSLCGLEASCVPAEEVLSVSGESCDSSDEMDTKESINGRAASRKKKSKRHKGMVTSLSWGGSLWAASASSLCVMLVLAYLWASHGALRGILQLVCAQRNAKG